MGHPHRLRRLREPEEPELLRRLPPHPRHALHAHRGALTLGFTNGGDSSGNSNGYLRAIGQVAFSPSDKFSITTRFHVGPEQNRSQTRGEVNDRWIVDTTILYTGIDKLALAANFDVAGEQNDPALVALGTRKAHGSRWGGIAGYGAYDWTEALCSVLRAEYFGDPQGMRGSETVAPGHNVDLVSLTAPSITRSGAAWSAALYHSFF